MQDARIDPSLLWFIYLARINYLLKKCLVDYAIIEVRTFYRHKFNDMLQRLASSET